MNSPQNRAKRELFLASLLLLLLELACIRWFPAHALYLTFFTNVMLLATFLGMSIGLLRTRKSGDALRFTPVAMLVAVAAGRLVEAIEPGLQRVLAVAGSDVVYFGTERISAELPPFVIPIELLGGFFFVLVAAIAVGPGQAMGRAFEQIDSRIQAYSINVAGSIAGILLFTLLSWWELPPIAWFAISGVLLVVLRPPRGWVPALTLLLPLALVGFLVHVDTGGRPQPNGAEKSEYWSPYYRIQYIGPPERNLFVNLIGHQQMSPQANPGFQAYALPHRLRQGSGGQPFRSVLVIGAGSGNDVAAALRQGAERVDAVEIDPVIQRLGARDHPDSPWSDPRVHTHIGDGRAFLRSSQQKYDLIVYALVDSLVLHSGYSNIRLESFLFTREALQDCRERLAPGGVLVLYNYFRRGWIVGRLQQQLSQVFGSDPIVLTSPWREIVEEHTNGGATLLIAGDTDAMRSELMAERAERADYPRLSQVRPPGDIQPATDDWPFLYLRRPMIPSLSLRNIAVLGGLAFLMLVRFGGLRTATGPRSPLAPAMFLLGAGFMLVETRAVVTLALLFGSTWLVNSMVFLAVLVMILLANLLVARFAPKRLFWCFAGLLVAIAINTVMEPDPLLGLATVPRAVGACLLVFLPILFAGIAFATLFAGSRAPERDLAANVAGAMVGGLLENLSMVLGFRLLGVVAIGLYLLAAASYTLAARARTR